MHAKLRHAQRGQAVVETVIFLPMFLIALFGIMWAVAAAVQSERVESAVRYAGLISQKVSPYADYSLYSLYTQVGSTTIPTVGCTPPPTDPLSDAAPTYESATATTASQPFWQPTSPTPTCSSAGFVGEAAGTGLTQDLLLSQQQPGMISGVAVPSALSAAFGTTRTPIAAAERFFRPVGINVILACYPALNTQVSTSLQYTTDTSAATTPAALSNTVAATTLSPSSNCMNW